MSENRKYEIYVVTSPSGKRYVGLTKAGAANRWKAHCQRAKDPNSDHPFHRAIRKYGKAAFTLFVYEVLASEQSAKQAEIDFIYAFQSNEKAFGYNISRGGDYDGMSGWLAMRERLKDPEFRTAYLKNLSDTKKADDWSDYAAMTAAQAEWRRRNPKQAYRQVRRMARIGAKKQGWALIHGERRGTYGRLWIDSAKVRKARKIYFARIAKQKIWDEMTPARRAEVIANMRDGASRSYKNPERREKAAEHMRKVQLMVDRKKQAAAASAGLKNYWARMKADPVAYKELMDGKRIKLREANLRHNQRRAQEQILRERQDSQ